jgi:hypothetical protein
MNMGSNGWSGWAINQSTNINRVFVLVGVGGHNSTRIGVDDLDCAKRFCVPNR